MFKKSYIASSLFLAMSCQLSYAQDQSADDGTQASQDESYEVIEVSGIRGSLNQAMNMKRQNMQVVDAIVAQDIGKFPDNNVVEALQRVTGVQVTDRGAGEVSTVSIRGLTDVTTTVNGRNIFTASGRSVALADIPAALLRSVEVYKTRSAAQIGSGIAGQIDITTQRPFNFEGSKMVFAARGIHQEQADKTDPVASLLLSDRWDAGDGEFGALLNVSYARTNYRDQNLTAGAMVPFMTMDPAAGFGPLERIFPDAANVAEDPVWQAGTENGLPFAAGSTLDINGVPTEYYLSRDAMFASDFTGERERPAVNLSLQWAPNDMSEYTFEAFYNGYRNESFNSLMFSFVDWWGDVDESANPVLFDGTNIIKERRVLTNAEFTSGDRSEESTDSYVYSLGGRWFIGDDLTVRSELIYQESEYETDFFAMRANRTGYGVDVDFNNDDGIPSLVELDNPATDIDESDLTNPNLWAVGELFDSGTRSEGDAITWKLDADMFVDSFGFTKLYFGGRYDKRSVTEADRDKPATNLVQPANFGDLNSDYFYTNSDFFDGEAQYPSSWVVPNGEYIFNNRETVRALYGFDSTNELVQMQKNFEIDEETIALYLQGDYAFEIGGKLFDGQIGLRWEDADRDMTFIDDAGTATQGSGGSSTILPSAVIRYHMTDDIIARAAYTETIRRPDFSQLSSTIIYQEDLTNIGYGTASGGNPDLEPVESKNLDLSLEYYFGEGSSVYATWFRRDIDGFVFDSRSVISRVSPRTNEEEDYIFSQPNNSSNGVLDGWEFGAVYFPQGLPDILDGFGIQASATLLDSEQDLPIYEDGELVGYNTRSMFGVSDTSYSTVFIYEKENYNARLSYVWRDDFLNAYDAPQFASPLGMYRRPEQSLDFQFSYDVTENLTFTIDGTNLTDEIYKGYYQYDTTHNTGNSIYSRTFALGVRYSM